MDRIKNAGYSVSMTLARVPELRTATRVALNTINRGLAEAQQRAPLSQERLVHDYISRYRRYEDDYAQQNDDTKRKLVAALHDEIIKFRNTIFTESERLNIPGLIPASLFESLPPSTSLGLSAPQGQYVPQSITGNNYAAPSVPSQRGRPSAPAAAGQRRHQPRRSQSMPFGPAIVEESAIVMTPLSMPHRPPPPSSRPHQGAAAPASYAQGGTTYAAPVSRSHGYSASVASTQTFGHGAAAVPTVVSRQSYESDGSLGSSTGDISVTLHGAAGYQAAGSAMAAPSNAQALYNFFSTRHPHLSVDQISNMVHNYLQQQQQQQQQAQSRRQ